MPFLAPSMKVKSGFALLLPLLLTAPELYPQAIQVYNNNVGIGTAAAGEKLDLVGNERLTGYLKFTNTSADPNDGKICNSIFGQGLNLVGINNDNTYRKILLWGEINQLQNNGTNQWAGSNTFAGQVKLSYLGAGVLATDGSGNVSLTPSGLSGANVLLRTGGDGFLYLDNFIRGTGLFSTGGDYAYFDGYYFRTRSPYGISVAQRDGTARGWVYYDGSENFGLLNKSGNWAVRTTNAATEIYGDLWVPWIHDSNNSNFVLDLNGQSRLHEVLVSSMLGTYVGYDSGRSGDRPYEWGYQEGGPWTYPYPDLVIGYHTGLKFGANYSYGGTRFYSDHPSRSTDMIFSVGDGDGNVRVTNNLFVGATVQAATFRSTSSARWKENIATMASALDVVRSLRGVTYQWKKGTSLAGQKDVGFLAEEVDQVLPEIVGHDAEGKASSIDYSRMSAVLVEAVKSLDQKNSVAAADLLAIRTQMAALELRSEQLAATRWVYLGAIAVALGLGFFIGRRRARR